MVTMPDIPAEAVEAAAQAYAVRTTGFYAFSGEMWREEYREHATHVLAAALPHLRERWLAEVLAALGDQERIRLALLDSTDWINRQYVGFAPYYLRDVLGAGVGAGGEG
jgi:hypothetical protein